MEHLGWNIYRKLGTSGKGRLQEDIESKKKLGISNIGPMDGTILARIGTGEDGSSDAAWSLRNKSGSSMVFC